MTIYGDCWRQRWIAINNCFCLFLEHKNWFCWKVVLSGSGKFWSKIIIMVKLIEKNNFIMTLPLLSDFHNQGRYQLCLGGHQKWKQKSGWLFC